MEKRLITIEKILIITVFMLVSFSSIFASELESPINEYDSIYKYNAIENNSISPDLVINFVGNPVEKLLEINDLNKNDFTMQLESIIEKQNSSLLSIEVARNEINDRGEIKSFLIGNNLKVLNFQIVQINNLVFRYNDLLIEIENTENGNQADYIYSQIKLLKDEQIEVKNFIFEKNKKFSLFGWIGDFL